MPTTDGKYKLIAKGEVCPDYCASIKKRPQRAANHYCRLLYKQYLQKGDNLEGATLEITFTDDKYNYVYDCEISKYEGDNQYKRYNIKSKLRSKELVKKDSGADDVVDVKETDQRKNVAVVDNVKT